MAPFLAIGLLSIASTAADWPGFRGAAVDGQTSEREVFQGKENIALQTAWRVEAGSGYSGIAVDERRVVTQFSDGASNIAIALDMQTGQELWRYRLGPNYPGHDGSHDGPIATPLLSGGSVFCLDPFGLLVALQAENGLPRWQTHLKEDHGASKPHYGFAASPMMLEGVLVVLLGGEKQAVAGFDPATGQLLWKAGSDQVGYQSPVPWTWADRKIVLAAGEKQIMGIAPKTGELLWSHEHGGSGARGSASLVPVPAGKNRLFLAHQNDQSVAIGLQVEEEGDPLQTLWETRNIRNSYNVAVYHQGHLYAYSNRFLTCVDAETGESKWRSRQPGDGFLVLVDGHLVILTKRGSLHVAPADPNGYHEMASLPSFDQLAWTPPSFSHGSIYVRGLKAIARVDISSSESPVAHSDRKSPEVMDSEFGSFLKEAMASDTPQAVVSGYLKKVAATPIIEPGGWIHFLYQGNAKDVAVAGDLFGARQEWPMKRLKDTDLFYHSQRLETDAMFTYVFIQDFKEMTPDPRNPNQTQMLFFGQDMEMSFSGETLPMSWAAMPSWSAPTYLEKAPVGKQGRLLAHELESKRLEKKIPLQVYLPTEYEGEKRTFPVAFVHGGKPALERGAWSNALDNLIGEKIPPLIVVFINFSLFSPSPQYLAMVGEELVPFVDQHYRTDKSSHGRANIGMGPTGSAAVLCSLRFPELFSKSGTHSVFMMDNALERVRKSIEASTNPPHQVFYLDWGKYDFRNPQEAWDMGAVNQKLTTLLKTGGRQVLGGELPEGTGWTSWRGRTARLLEALFPLEE